MDLVVEKPSVVMDQNMANGNNNRNITQGVILLIIGQNQPTNEPTNIAPKKQEAFAILPKN